MATPDFAGIYFIRRNGTTYEAYRTPGEIIESGSDLVADVLEALESSHPNGGIAIKFGVAPASAPFDMGTDWWTLNGMHDVTIVGQGMGLTHIVNDVSTAFDSEPFSFTDCDRVTLKDFTVSAKGDARTTSDGLDLDNSDDSLIQRVRILEARGSGIAIDGKDVGAEAVGNIIRDCVITGTGQEGIHLFCAEDSRVVGNHIYGVGEVGVKLNRNAGTSKGSHRNVVSLNVIDSCDEAGMEILDGTHNLVTQNIIRNNGQGGSGSDDGVRIDYVSLTSEKNSIIGNAIYDDQGTPTQDRGVSIPDAATDDTLVVGNQFWGNINGAILNSGTGTVIKSNVGLADN